jgi:hypothetical protein
MLADALGFAAAPHGTPRSSDEILVEFPDSIRKHLPGAEELAAEIGKEISGLETA